MGKIEFFYLKKFFCLGNEKSCVVVAFRLLVVNMRVGIFGIFVINFFK